MGAGADASARRARFLEVAVYRERRSRSRIGSVFLEEITNQGRTSWPVCGGMAHSLIHVNDTA